MLLLFDCSLSADGNLYVAADCALDTEGWLMVSRAGVCRVQARVELRLSIVHMRQNRTSPHPLKHVFQNRIPLQEIT